jgi:hypothetical protein
MQLLKIIGAILASAAIIAGLWFGGWWLREENVNRTTDIANNSMARQQALREKTVDLYTQIALLDIKAAEETDPAKASVVASGRAALVDSYCSTYLQMTPTLVPAELIVFSEQEC